MEIGFNSLVLSGTRIACTSDSTMNWHIEVTHFCTAD